MNKDGGTRHNEKTHGRWILGVASLRKPILVLLAVPVLIGIIVFSVEYFQAERLLNQRLLQLREGFGPGLAAGLADQDLQRIEAGVTAIQNDSFVAGVVVFDAEGGSITSAGLLPRLERNRPGSGIFSAMIRTVGGDWINDGALERFGFDLFDPRKPGKKVGRVGIYWSRETIQRAIGDFFVPFPGALFIEAGVFVVLFVSFHHRYSLLPISAATRFVQRTMRPGSETDSFGVEPVGNRSPELQSFVEALNRLRQRMNEVQRVGEERVQELENRLQMREQVLRDERDTEREYEVNSRILRAISHDLSQPLTAQKLLLNMLPDANSLSNDVSEVITNLKIANQTLESMFNTLLDYSRLEAGTVRTNRTTVPLAPLIERLQMEFQPWAEGKGLRFRVVGRPVTVRTDPALLQRIVAAFLNNAIHFTTKGGVLLGCRIRQRSLRIEVWDTGPGLSDTVLATIFQGVAHPQRKKRLHGQGLGLGLAITRGLARLLAHPLDVVSWPGHGSRFAVTIPMESETTVPEVAPFVSSVLKTPMGLEGKRIMVIEDDAALRKAFEQSLNKWGCQAVVAKDGGTALAALVDPQRYPHAILCDYQLGEEETGEKLIVRLRKHCRRDIPTIITTGGLHPDFHRKMGALGMYFLQKPFYPAQLRSLLMQVLRASMEKTSG